MKKNVSVVKKQIETIAILGMGPSALFLGALLSHKGFKVHVLDPKNSWDHPCGGPVLAADLQEFPILSEYGNFSEVRSIRFLSPSGRENVLAFSTPLEICQRDQLMNFLKEKLLIGGGSIHAAKVEKVQRERNGWCLDTKEGIVRADFLVGADGAASFFRKSLGFLPFSDRMTMEVSYHLPPLLEKSSVVKFLEEGSGSFWAFPTPTGTQVRLWTRSQFLQAVHLFDQLDILTQNILQYQVPHDVKRKVAQIPTVRGYPRSLFSEIVGPDWAAVGEAAGFVDPVSQEGLYYALRSAELLVIALTQEGNFQNNYRSRVKDVIAKPLRKRSRLRKFADHRRVIDWIVKRGKKTETYQKLLMGLSGLGRAPRAGSQKS